MKTLHLPGGKPPLPGPKVYVILLILFIVVTIFGRGLGMRRARGGLTGGRPLGVMPGEFEPQEAVLLAWPLLGRPRSQRGTVERDAMDRIACDIVGALRPDVRVAVPASKASARDRIARLLAEANIPGDSVEFISVPCNYQWIRDYGPACLRSSDGLHVLVDADYVGAGLVSLHPQEDRFPKALGAQFGLRVLKAPIAVQHGNLLSNGRGLCIATDKLVRENRARGYRQKDVAQVLREFYGAEQVLFLDLLQGEPTGHVDMFATFTSADTVVVGRYAEDVDPVNAAILDRNAARLAGLGRPHGRLRVVRIPMPRRPRLEGGQQFWPTYTNVIFGNGKLLVPIYPGLDPEAESAALRVYEKLLPDRDIVGIDANPLLPAGGSLHCAAMNLFTLGSGDTALVDHQPR